MKKHLLLIPLFAIAFQLFAQTPGTVLPPIPPPPPPLPPPFIPPRPPLPPIIIVVRNLPEKFSPIQVQSGSAEVRISGLTAETTVTYTMYNPNGRALEGEFQFPLPPGSTVTGLALDINGKMIDAAIVQKQRAKEVFEAVEREGLDPALVEDVGANTYRTRIWPIPEKGRRTVRLKFISTVIPVDGKAVYTLPMRFKNKLNQMKLKIAVIDPKGAPKVENSAFSNFNFANWERQIVGEQTLEDIELSEDLKITVPFLPGDIRYEKDPSGVIWYQRMTNLPPKPAAAPFTLPKAVSIVWDASMSRQKQDHNMEFQLLKGYFAAPIFKNASVPVELTLLRNVLENPVKFTVKDGNIDDLLATLKKVVYDGATNLALLEKFNANKGFPTLIFTDGVSNFGKEVKDLKPDGDGVNWNFISVTTSSNTSLLAYLARAFHGNYADLTTRTTKDAVTLLQGIPLPSTLQGTADSEQAEVGAYLRETGKLATDAAKNLDIATLPEGTLIRTEYALMKLERMKQDPHTADADFVALGQQFGIVTPGTSMLVLESAEQYIQYKIRPPESMPEWCKRYDAQAEKQYKQPEVQTRDVKTVMVGYQREIIGWYEHKGEKWEPPKDLPIVRAHENPPAAAEVDSDEEPPVFSATTHARESSSRVNEVAYSAVRTADFEMASGTANHNFRTASRPHAESRPNAPVTHMKSRQTESQTTVKMKPWDSNSSYMAAMRAASIDKAYETYLSYRDKEGDSVGFYTDCADFFREAGKADLAARVASNLAEMDFENVTILRVLGYQLRFIGELDGAERVFRKVLKLAPEEAQSYRDLALTLDEAKRYQEAADMMYVLVTRVFDNRFRGIEYIAVTELNRIVARAKRDNMTIKGIDPIVIRPIEVDLRVVISWDADLSDMDLHVVDPWGEDCFYGHRYNRGGGRLSYDFTQGYGPEEFMTRKSLPGEYRVFTHYYGQQSARVIGPVTLYAEIFTDYGRPNESKKTVIFRLGQQNATVDIAFVTGKGDSQKPEVKKPQYRDYQVKANETLHDIAKRELGDAKRVDEIRKINGIQGGIIKTGQIIKLPTE